MFSSNHLSIPLGIIIGLISSFIQSLGLTIQRKSHVLNQSLPNHHQRVEHRRPLWLLGFAIFISSNVLGSFVQIASLPVVILAPLGAVSLLWNAFFARLLLGDVFSPWMILGTILIAGGAVLIAFFGIVPEQTRSLEDLLALFRRPTFIIYFSLLGFVTFVCLSITHITEFSLSRRIAKSIPADCDSSSRNISPSSININLPTHAANLTTSLLDEINDSSLATERTPLLDPKPRNISSPPTEPIDPNLKSFDRTRLLLAISYASFSGIISGMCLLFAKSGVELLLLTLGGKNQFWRWEAWVLVLGLIVFALLQLWYLHKALVLADPTLVCPSAFCFYNLSSIVNGLVYFDQFSLIPPTFLGLVTLGIFVLLCGVWVVSIQSGGGGVDVGTWNEEAVNLSREDVPLYLEPEDIQSSSGAVVMTHQQAPSQAKVQFDPVPMEYETRFESSLPSIPASPEINNGLGHGIGPGTDSHRNHSTTSTPRRAETQLYGVRRIPSHRPRRPTADFTGSTSTSQLAHARTVSYPHPGLPHRTSLSPPPTLSTGFQIGLSPLSPGFTITPRERRRRFGIGGPLVDIPNDDVGGVLERRRTVSEGEVPNRVRNEREDGDTEQGDDIPHDSSSYSTHTVDDSGHAGRGWTWFRSVFAWKD